jgi:hypothetical protein
VSEDPIKCPDRWTTRLSFFAAEFFTFDPTQLVRDGARSSLGWGREGLESSSC